MYVAAQPGIGSSIAVFALGVDGCNHTRALEGAVRLLQEASAASGSAAPIFQFIPAVDGSWAGPDNLHSLKLQGVLHRSWWKRPPKAFSVRKHGHVAIPQQSLATLTSTLTHRRAWEQMLDQNLSAAVIFEDGPIEGLTQAPLSALGSALEAMRRADATWEYLNLGRCDDGCQAQVEVGRVTRTGQAIVTSPSSLCTHAYVVTAAGARKLLAFSLPVAYNLDHFIALLFRRGVLRQYSLSPPSFSRQPASSHRARQDGEGPREFVECKQGGYSSLADKVCVCMCVCVCVHVCVCV